MLAQLQTLPQSTPSDVMIERWRKWFLSHLGPFFHRSLLYGSVTALSACSSDAIDPVMSDASPQVFLATFRSIADRGDLMDHAEIGRALKLELSESPPSHGYAKEYVAIKKPAWLKKIDYKLASADGALEFGEFALPIEDSVHCIAEGQVTQFFGKPGGTVKAEVRRHNRDPNTGHITFGIDYWWGPIFRFASPSNSEVSVHFLFPASLTTDRCASEAGVKVRRP